MARPKSKTQSKYIKKMRDYAKREKEQIAKMAHYNDAINRYIFGGLCRKKRLNEIKCMSK